MNNSNSKVTTFGLNEEQNKVVKNALPAKGYELLNTNAPTDLIAVPASALIINASALNAYSKEMIIDYFTEIGGCITETVFWLGCPEPPEHLRTKFKCYQSFKEIAPNLKYHLLSAHRGMKKANDFSKKLANSLLILSFIRSHPGIKTQELANKLELSTRTVQRYISTLQAAGEWIEYDCTQKGWFLQDGVSIFFGNY